MTDKRVLFVSGRESFIISSIRKKLEAEGIDCIFSTMDLKSLTDIRERMGSIVYIYIDDPDDFTTEGLTYFRDLCTDHDCEIFLIGYEDAVTDLKNRFFQELVTGEFYRPVNAGQLVEEIIKEVNKEATVGHKKHILVVDDSGVMLSTIKGWLDDKYRVTPVNSALNAITFISKERPDLILLDYEMPTCSGKQFLEMLRTDVTNGDIPVIFLTGRDDTESVRSVVALKPAGYLLKSLPKEKIVSEVDAFFARQKG